MTDEDSPSSSLVCLLSSYLFLLLLVGFSSPYLMHVRLEFRRRRISELSLLQLVYPLHTRRTYTRKSKPGLQREKTQKLLLASDRGERVERTQGYILNDTDIGTRILKKTSVCVYICTDADTDTSLSLHTQVDKPADESADSTTHVFLAIFLENRTQIFFSFF